MPSVIFVKLLILPICVYIAVGAGADQILRDSYKGTGTPHPALRLLFTLGWPFLVLVAIVSSSFRRRYLAGIFCGEASATRKGDGNEAGRG